MQGQLPTRENSFLGHKVADLKFTDGDIRQGEEHSEILTSKGDHEQPFCYHAKFAASGPDGLYIRTSYQDKKIYQDFITMDLLTWTTVPYYTEQHRKPRCNRRCPHENYKHNLSCEVSPKIHTLISNRPRPVRRTSMATSLEFDRTSSTSDGQLQASAFDSDGPCQRQSCFTLDIETSETKFRGNSH